MKSNKRSNALFLIVVYVVCGILTILSLMPFVIMIVNSTRSTYQIQEHALWLIPSKYLIQNFQIFNGKSFNPVTGFVNSAIVATSATACTIYFSTLTAFAIVAYNWKFRNAFYTFIIAVMMVPGQLTAIGFYKMVWKVGLTNNYLPLIIPAIAAPASVFFMRQFMIPALPMEILQSARVDGAGEFRTFNQIVLPIMKPAMATQAIFSFVGSWNSLFMPSVLLNDIEKYTMPMMVNLLRGDIYKREFGCIYLGIFLTVLPLFVVYFALSKYIIAGVALGGVKG